MENQSLKTDRLSDSRGEKSPSVAGNLESLVKWKFVEEKKEYSRDGELLIMMVGAAMVLLAFILKTYIFGALLILATFMLISISRKKPRDMLFNITPIGIFMEDDFVEIEKIIGFNIVDDPGDRARLIIKIERMVHINEVIPIYDVNITDIEDALKKLEVPKEDDLELTPMDRLTAILI